MGKRDEIYMFQQYLGFSAATEGPQSHWMYLSGYSNETNADGSVERYEAWLMEQPEGFVEKDKENFLCKLKHSLYELK